MQENILPAYVGVHSQAGRGRRRNADRYKILSRRAPIVQERFFGQGETLVIDVVEADLTDYSYILLLSDGLSSKLEERRPSSTRAFRTRFVSPGSLRIVVLIDNRLSCCYVEIPYTFTNSRALLADFWKDVDNWRS